MKNTNYLSVKIVTFGITVKFDLQTKQRKLQTWENRQIPEEFNPK